MNLKLKREDQDIKTKGWANKDDLIKLRGGIESLDKMKRKNNVIISESISGRF